MAKFGGYADEYILAHVVPVDIVLAEVSLAEVEVAHIVE